MLTCSWSKDYSSASGSSHVLNRGGRAVQSPADRLVAGKQFERGWTMLPTIDRVYVNRRARDELGWKPRFDFACAIASLRQGGDIFSPLARAVGSKGYHAQTFAEGPYPVETSG